MVKIIPHYISYPSGEREVDVLENKIEFILSQPQDFWLLYVMSMNWDQNDDVVNAIIDRADADIAIIAVLFWYSGPSILFNKPEGHPETNAERILKNLRAGWYHMFAYGESIYATRDIIEAAYSKPQHGKAARKRRGSRDIPQSPIKILNRLSPFRQAVLALAFLAGWIWLSVRAVNWISVLFG